MASAVCVDGSWPHALPVTNAPCVGEIVRLPLPMLCYNPTIYHASDGLRLIVKAGRRGARLWTIPLDAALDGDDCSVELTDLSLLAYHGHEDARHFRWTGDDWIAFAGVYEVNGALRVDQALAALSSTPGRTFSPWTAIPEQPRPVEKNWGFFEYNERLLAVYHIAGQRIVDFKHGQARHLGSVRWRPRWCGGAMRGGASPVLHEGLWWSFFHGALDTRSIPSRFYSVGCYAFENRPPFRPVLYTPSPVIVPPREGWPRDLGVSVVWPGGAVWHGGRWLLSLGIHETWSAITTIDHEGLKGEMVAV